MNVLIVVIGTLGCNIHRNVRAIESTTTHYIIVEEDGSRINLNKERYMLTILR